MKCGIVDSLCYMDGLRVVFYGEKICGCYGRITRRVYLDTCFFVSREGCRRAMKKLVPRVSSSRFWRDPGNEVGGEYLTSFPFIVMLFYF